MAQRSEQLRKVASSWKEIAAHFGVTVRTAQIWEAERALPVHRMPGVKGRVYAYADELDAWAKGEFTQPGTEAREAEFPPARPARRKTRTRLWLSAGAIVTAAAGLALWSSRPDSTPSSFTVTGRTLVIRNAEGEPVWKHEFPEEIRVTPGGKGNWIPFPEVRPWIGDLDGDGRREILFTRSIDPTTGHSSELYCFESGGQIRWRFTPGRLIETRKEKFPPPYCVRAVKVVEGQGGKPPIVLVIGIHGFNYPSYVAALSARGEVLREYWNSGHLHDAALADLDSDGQRELYIHANHNPTRSTSLIALDPYDFGGASRESDADYQLLGLGAPRELGRVLLPASELTRRLQDMTIPNGVNVQHGRMVVHAAQTSRRADVPGPPGVFFQFGPRLEVTSVEYAWTFRGAFDELVRRGRIDPYDLKADLERMKKVVFITPWAGEHQENGKAANPRPR